MNKTTKLFRIIMFAAICTVAAGTFSSCNEDEDPYVYEPLTQQEKTAQISAMQGNYSGHVYYGLTNYTQMTDSLNIQWTILAADSTLTISNFPMKVFGQYITDADLKTALENDSTHSLKADLHLYRPYYTTGALDYTSFVVVPKTTSDYAVTLPLAFGEESHDVTFNFSGEYSSYYYSQGEFYQNRMWFYLILRSISVDNGPARTANCILGFTGTKK